MVQNFINILLVEDNRADARLVMEMLRQANIVNPNPRFDLIHTERLKPALLRLAQTEVDLILLDLSLPDSYGLETLHRVLKAAPDVPVVVLSGLEDTDVTLQAVQAGAQDYVVKGQINNYLLDRVIRYAIERHQAEQLLRKSSAFNQSVLDSLSANIAVLDRQGNIIAVNQAWKQFGQENNVSSPERIGVGVNYLDVCRQALAERDVLAQESLSGILTVLAGEKTQCSLEYPCHSPEEERWFIMNVTPLTYNGQGVVVSHKNITEQKLAETKLQRRNRELGLLNQIIAASMLIHEPHEILEFTCAQLGKTFDLPRATATLLEDNNRTAVIVTQYLRDNEPSAVGKKIPVGRTPLVQHILAYGGPFAVPDVRREPRLKPALDFLQQYGIASLLILPLTIKSKVIGTITLEATQPRVFAASEIDLAWSITDQVSSALARIQLDREQRLLSTAVEKTVEIVIITDAQGVIQYVNSAFERVTGYTKAEAIGQNPKILNSGVQDAAFYQNLWATILAGQVWHGQFVNRKKDGALFTEQATVTPVLDKDGNISNFVAVKRDVTEDLKLEEQYRQAQKMDAVGRLAGGVAHDFNNLLTVITGYTELLLYRFAETDEDVKKDLEQIRNASDRAAALTRQLLAFSRRQVLQPKVIDLNDIITNISKMLRRLIGEDIDLVTKPGQSLGRIKADPGSIEQVLMNLVVNARDAMPHGGKLTIETSNIFLDESYADQHLNTKTGWYVMLAVSDTGIGMDTATRERVFEPFFTTKSQDQGTGLGLATVYGIVTQSDGHIWIYSEPGLGSTFKIYFPLTERPAEPILEHPATVRADRHGHETILLAEDDLLVRALVQEALREYGYVVLEAGNGQEAVQLYEQNQSAVQLLITDVVMPGGINGRQLVNQLRTINPGLKVLYMSGYPENNITHRGILEEDVAFLQKPFSPRKMAHKVREILDNGHGR